MSVYKCIPVIPLNTFMSLYLLCPLDEIIPSLFSPLWPIVSSQGNSRIPTSKFLKPSRLSYTSLERDDMELLAWVGSTIHRKIPDYSRYVQVPAGQLCMLQLDRENRQMARNAN